MSYKDTVFLPKTSLPIKVKPEAEVALLAGMGTLYNDLRAKREGAMPWVLHDGPPYANGDIHIGHALNKTLKDVIVRGHNLLGCDAPFTPGWDCHGLPIEWKVEEQWRKDKKDKNADPAGFRADCRAFAEKWVETQKGQFKRLGVLADWDDYFGTYRTMSPEWESGILYAFHEMVRRGLVYRANKPVLWSPAERTALAEAEVTEQEHMVPNIWLRFPVHSGPLFFEEANLLVWTTTPWSLPGNVAVAFNPDIEYGLYETPSGRYVVADALAEQAIHESNRRLRDVPASDLEGHTLFHPLGNGYKAVEAIPASFVRATAGTGFVHVGPAHSTEDWIAWRDYKGSDAAFPNPIAENGVYHDDVRVFAGIAVTKGKKLGPANDAVCEHLLKNGMLYRHEDRPLTMQHSWRSDAVLITRAAPQVFITIDGVRQTAIDELEGVKFNPPHAKQRMTSMLRDRPDWLVSRQRLWGTPLGLFVHKTTGAICDDPHVLAVTHQTLMDAGSEEWFSLTVEDIFKYAARSDHDEWERLDDVLDVWFDSGCVHYMMNTHANMVVEGTDQSRGWFQSSLLVAVLLGRRAPYSEVLTHGFTLDSAGKKMSKSQGNVLDPLKVIDQHGADTLRVWVASSVVTDDLRVSMGSMDGFAEVARKVRNTMRYMVGALSDFERQGELMPEQMPELERYMLHRTQAVNDALAEMIRTASFSQYMATINAFCVHDLSSLWFDIRKDTLYCDGATNRRRAYLHALDTVLQHMLRWVAPVMVFAAEEVSKARYGADSESIHLAEWLHPVAWRNDALAAKWERIIDYRSDILGAIEQARAEAGIKASTECELSLLVQQGSQVHRDLDGINLADLAIVGEAHLIAVEAWPFETRMDIAVVKADNDKCDRCWLAKPDVHECGSGKLCDRCCEVVG